MTFNTQNIQGCFEKVQLLQGGMIEYRTHPGIAIDMSYELIGECITVYKLDPIEEAEMTDLNEDQEDDIDIDIDENAVVPPKFKMTPKERDIKLAIHKFTQ